MLGAAGFLAPEILASAGVIPQSVEEVTWFRTGVIPSAGQYGKYWMDPYSLFWIEAIMMNFAELRRWQVRGRWAAEGLRGPQGVQGQGRRGCERVFF